VISAETAVVGSKIFVGTFEILNLPVNIGNAPVHGVTRYAHKNPDFVKQNPPVKTENALVVRYDYFFLYTCMNTYYSSMHSIFQTHMNPNPFHTNGV
jgi:hypothetical protein